MYNRIFNLKNIHKYDKTIILMRHGEAIHNKCVIKAVENAIEKNSCPVKAKENELMKKEYINAPLTINGKKKSIKQFKIIKKYINIDNTIILSSPLIRALDTANCIQIENDRNKIIPFDCLIERRTKRPCDNFTLLSINHDTPEETNEEVFKRSEYFCSNLHNFHNNVTIIVTHKRFLMELSKNEKIFNNYGNSYFEPSEFRVFVKL